MPLIWSAKDVISSVHNRDTLANFKTLNGRSGNGTIERLSSLPCIVTEPNFEEPQVLYECELVQ